jgi:sulfotransferase family protein
MSSIEQLRVHTVVSSSPLANLIIAGVNKAGTTSLYSYLSRHPEICPSNIKETHYFMPVVLEEPLPSLEQYAAYFKHWGGERYRMEASPRYIFGGARLAEAIHENLGDPKIIFMLRHPIDRLFSYFRHMKNDRQVPADMSCDEYVQRALNDLPATLNRANGKPVQVYRESVFVRGLAQGFYADYLKEWYSAFPDCVRVCFFEHLKKEPRVLVQSLCEWLSLDPAVYQNMEFSQENRTMTHRNAFFFSIADLINTKYESFWRRHRSVKEWARSIYCLVNERSSEDSYLSEQGRAELESVYAPHNKTLARMLSERGYRDLPPWLRQYARA